MKRGIILSLLLALCVSCSVPDQDVITANQLVERVLPDQGDSFIFEKLECKGDYFELSSKDNKIIIKGNNANSMAVGLNYYLKYYCNVTISWIYGEHILMPKELPTITTPLKVDARCKDRFFLNYCTFGYTMPWWGWDEWEHFIDWMALNGVNMPLAITGQESVWYRVWQKLGLSDEEIRNYFTGPAHLPWHRMSNIDCWQGGLPHSWLDGQEKLQKKIVGREREFNMKPVLPAFAGHVPEALRKIYPDSKISRMSRWNGFAEEHCSHFLDPMDPLFTTIQKEFLTEQTALYGTDHVYGADPFNEVDPPTWDLDFLATVSDTIYSSMADVDPDAVWLQMTWLFYYDRHLWQDDRIEAFISAVPKGKMILLDYYCEHTEVWRQTNSYHGHEYLWCYLGNFGGNTMMIGDLSIVDERVEETFKSGGENLGGVGSTLEGLDVNPLMYDYIFEKAWNIPTSPKEWIIHYADRRVGFVSKEAREAWTLLNDHIYTSISDSGQSPLTNARPSLTGDGSWTTTPDITYDNAILLEAWGKLLSIEDAESAAYKFDVVNLGRQYIGNLFVGLRDEYTKAYNKRDLKAMQSAADDMRELLADFDRLLSTHIWFSADKWFTDAQKIGVNDQERAYYLQNARNIITTWGERDQFLTDYANRSLSGMMLDYYQPRWEIFFDRTMEAVKNKTPFDEKALHDEITAFEWNWVIADYQSPEPSKESPIAVAQELYMKYK